MMPRMRMTDINSKILRILIIVDLLVIAVSVIFFTHVGLDVLVGD